MPYTVLADPSVNPCRTRRHDAIRAVALAAMFDNEEVEGGRYSARLLLHDPGSSGSGRPRDAISDCQVGATKELVAAGLGWGPACAQHVWSAFVVTYL